MPDLRSAFAFCLLHSAAVDSSSFDLRLKTGGGPLFVAPRQGPGACRGAAAPCVAMGIVRVVLAVGSSATAYGTVLQRSLALTRTRHQFSCSTG